jgi:prepilin-type N-terminal cleavage/methylation domain-containing protein
MMGNSGRLSIRSSGFSLIEILVVMLIMAIMTAIALPSALNSLKGYRLHSDATSIASYLNVVRMKAASQYAPYRLVVNTDQGKYTMEKLCGITPVSSDAACVSPYSSFSTPVTEGGFQYVSTGNKFWPCRPPNVTGGTYPGTIAGDPAACTSPVVMYFNTRGSPVDNSGGPLGNGGAVLYIRNQNNLVDGITVSPGGRVSVSMWTGSGWAVR